MASLAIILFTIFLTLALLHISWGFGSTIGFEDAIPKNESGEPVLKPKRTDSFIVGIGLLLFGTFYLIKVEIINFEIPSVAISLAQWIIPIIFFLRSIGDFKYVGFTKKIKSTTFAQKDSKYYSPLCLAIAVIGFILGIS